MDEQTKNKNKNLLIPSLKADRKMNIVQKRRAFLFSSRKNRGSMTVEASMVLPVFLFFLQIIYKISHSVPLVEMKPRIWYHIFSCICEWRVIHEEIINYCPF